MSGKAKAIIGAGALGVIAVLVLIFMWVPQFLIGDTVALHADFTEAYGTQEVMPYKNTLDMHLGRVIVSCDIPKKERDACLNAVKGLAGDKVAVYVHGVEDAGVRYTMYVSANKSFTSAYVELGESNDSWEEAISSRVVYEEKGDRLSVE